MSYLRKKLQAIMACADFKGYLREVTGYPLTLTDCMGTDLVSLSVTGNAVQDGTPSPDAPVEVQGVGEKTGNLLDAESIVDTTEDTNMEIIEYSGRRCLTWIDSANTSKHLCMEGQFKENTQYTFAFTGYSEKGMTISIIYTDGTSSSLGILGGSWNTVYKQTLAGKTVSYWKGSHNYGQHVYLDLANSQILEGSYTTDTMPPFEPYGYKVPVEVSGINLFDVSQITGTTGTYGGYVQDGAIYVTGYPYATGFTPEGFLAMTGLKEGDTFTTAADYEQVYQPPNPTSQGAQWITFAKKPSAPADLSGVRFGTKGALKTTTIPEGFNNDNYYGMYIYGGSGTPEAGQVRAIYRNLRVYKGTYAADTMPPFEPYHEPQTVSVYTDKPLYGLKLDPTSTGYYTYMDADGNKYLGDTITIDFDNRTATRTDNLIYASLAGKSILYYASSFDESKGLYVGSFAAGGKTHYIDTDGVDKTWGRESIMCTSLPTGNNPSAPAISTGTVVGDWAGNIKVRLPKSEVDAMTGDTIDNKLTAWWAENMQDCWALYITEPTTTDISALQDWDAMPSTWRGTVVISAGTVIQPSSMTARYYTTKKED